MIPKKIYLRKAELEDNYMCERMVSCDEPFDCCNVEYTNLSQLWHHSSVMPTETNKNIIYVTTFDEIYIERIPRCLGGKLTDNSWNDFTMRECVIGWAYVNDLLPKGGENETT